MAINVKIDRYLRVEGLDYPLLMEGNSGVIVFMTSHGCGSVIKSTSSYKFSHNSMDWAMGEFKPFNGTISLSNK